MTKKFILVINCGSSSLKFSLIDPITGHSNLSGIAERLLSQQATITINHQGNDETIALSRRYDHQETILLIVEKLHQLALTEQVAAIGHRVVHGGENYSLPTLITDAVKQSISLLAKLAPLHNPANLVGIEAATKAFPTLQQVAIFDTAFHQTMPEHAYIYGLPFELYKEHAIRRYGFHGTSHYFVANQAAKLINKPLNQCNFITAHLGNGCSVTAIKNGKSCDTSMGLTPLEGLVMGTRSGDIDPGILFYLVEQLNYSLDEVNNLINKKSGLLGISGISNDCRTLEAEINDNNSTRAQLALDIFCYRVAKSIASYSACLTSLDGLIFTGGIGENSQRIRKKILSQLSLLNFSIDDAKNQTIPYGEAGIISTPDSRACWVIPTNEEWVIAEQTSQLLFNASSIKE